MQKKNFLPSKKFVFLILASAGIVLAALYASSKFGTTNIFAKKPTPETVGDSITRDSNKNSIPDWEESLWGLDPNGDGKENKAIITTKKSAAGVAETTPVAADASEATKTEQFSRNLLATVLALKQDDALTPESIANLGDSIGKNIDAQRSLTPTYFANNIRTIEDTPTNEKTYITSLKKIVLAYEQSDIGDEFDAIAEMISATDPASAIQKLNTIAATYTALSKDLVALPTPKSAIPHVLALANASAAIADGIQKTTVLSTDAITGMVGLDEFVNQNETFFQASIDLATYIDGIARQ